METMLEGMRFGVEVETIKITRETAAKAIQNVVGGRVRYVSGTYDAWEVIAGDERIWKVVNDASLNAVPSHYRAEVVTPILVYPNDVVTLQNVIRAVKKAGAKVNHQCGIHIHADAASMDTPAITRLAKYVNKQENLILQALGVSPSRLGSYTKPIDAEFIEKLERRKPKTLDQLNTAWYGFRNTEIHHYDRTRYSGLNLHAVFDKGTVEFRWFEGTLHSGKIKGYIQLCLLLAHKAIHSRAACSKKRAYDPATAKYDFRVVLLRLGAIGEEFKTMRFHLLESMSGCSSYKNGIPERVMAKKEEV